MCRVGKGIYRRKDGRYEGRYLAVIDGDRKLRSVYGRTYLETRDKLEAAKAVAAKSQAQSPKLPVDRDSAGMTPSEKTMGNKKLSLYCIAEEWLEEVRKSRKPSTYAKYRNVYEKHLVGKLDDINLWETGGSVSLSHFDREGMLSDSLRQSIYSVLSQTVQYGIRRYGIMEIKIVRDVPNGRKMPPATLNQSEQARLLRVLYEDMDIFKMGILLCLTAGLRLGELCALRWSDIDFSMKVLNVRRTVQRLPAEAIQTDGEGDERKRTRLAIMEPKTPCSVREIPLPDDILELLLNFRGRDDAAYLFGGDKPMEPRTYQYKYKKYLKAAGVEAKNFHLLRHTFASNSIEADMDAKSLSEILGHADVRITLNRYVHPSGQTKRRHLDSLFRVYQRICGQKSGRSGRLAG